MKNEINIPIWEKYSLTLNEASQYFGIGTNKLKSIIENFKNDSDFILMNGVKVLIKRKKFEDFLDSTSTI